MPEELDQSFDEIDDFIQGKMTLKEEANFLQRLETDKKLFADYQLWVKLDDWLEEIPFAEIQQGIKEKEEETAKETGKIIPFSWLYLRQLAALVFLVGGLTTLVYQEFYNHKSIETQVIFLEKMPVYINSPEPLAEVALVEKIPLKITVSEYPQKDTTYQLTLKNKRPIMVFRVPKVDSAFANESTIRWNNTLHLFELSLYPKTFNVMPSQQWKKLK